MIMTDHTIAVRGTLPWGQLDTQYFKVKIGCTIGKIDKPTSVPIVVYALGLDHFEYPMP